MEPDHDPLGNVLSQHIDAIKSKKATDSQLQEYAQHFVEEWPSRLKEVINEYNARLKPHGVCFGEPEKGYGPTNGVGSFVAVQANGDRVEFRLTEPFSMRVNVNGRIDHESAIGCNADWPADGSFPDQKVKGYLARIASGVLRRQRKASS